ncbi:MAG: 50S ribosomal protein L10 [Bacilli bacterium]|nr:50S ribosomal protein L10 [Bacilli bacterium]MCI9585514.1 50S ribosomal protein L10 [Bacilli bacterium]
MANQKILDKKQEIIDEISAKTKDSSSVVFFEYQGLTAMETNALRRLLRETDSDFKIYKNTLVKRALDTLKIDLTEHLEGPKAVAFSSDAVAPIKVLSDFAKKHPALVLKVGIVEGEIADEAKLKELSAIPSREGLLTMLAGGLMGTVRDLSISLDLYAKELEEK